MELKSASQIKNKKGLSTVVATVLIILLTVVSVSIVWVFVKNLINEKTQGVQSCFDVDSGGKVAINNYYTCYNKTSGEVQFSIDIKDATIDSLIIAIAAAGNSKSFTLTNNFTTNPNLKLYPNGAYGGQVKLPGKNEGLTYVAKGFPLQTKVDSIRIAPVIDDKQCDASDETYEISECSQLAD
jgi:hypothetical protein